MNILWCVSLTYQIPLRSCGNSGCVATSKMRPLWNMVRFSSMAFFIAGEMHRILSSPVWLEADTTNDMIVASTGVANSTSEVSSDVRKSIKLEEQAKDASERSFSISSPM